MLDGTNAMSLSIDSCQPAYAPQREQARRTGMLVPLQSGTDLKPRLGPAVAKQRWSHPRPLGWHDPPPLILQQPEVKPKHHIDQQFNNRRERGMAEQKVGCVAKARTAIKLRQA